MKLSIQDLFDAVIAHEFIVHQRSKLVFQFLHSQGHSRRS